MRITRKFLQLTKKTYPYGTESQLESYLPQGYTKDEFGNYYILLVNLYQNNQLYYT